MLPCKTGYSRKLNSRCLHESTITGVSIRTVIFLSAQPHVLNDAKGRYHHKAAPELVV